MIAATWLLLAASFSGCAPIPATILPTPASIPTQPADPRSLSQSFHSTSLQVDASILPAYLTVNTILQDHRGWLWFATDHGLYRYNGYDLTLFAPQANNLNTISGENVTSLTQGPSGSLWIGAGENRLDRYDPRTLQFSHFDLDPAYGGALHISAILEAQDGRVWIGTREKGLYRLDPATGIITPDPTGDSAGAWILSLIQTQDGTIWLSRQDRAGVDRIDAKTGDSLHFSAEGDSSGGRLALDRDGSLWLATTMDGLFHYFPPGNAWVQYATGRFSTIPVIFSIIFVDPAGLVWLGTEDRGLFQLDPQTGLVTSFESNAGNANSLSSNHVQSLLEDASGLLWVGMRAGGLDKLDFRTGIQSIHAVHGNPNSLSSNLVNTLYVDPGGTLWIGTQDGLDSLASGAWMHYQPETENPNSLAGRDVTAVFVDHLGRLWVGTRGWPEPIQP